MNTDNSEQYNKIYIYINIYIFNIDKSERATIEMGTDTQLVAHGHCAYVQTAEQSDSQWVATVSVQA